jgi:hypothetical protein
LSIKDDLKNPRVLDYDKSISCKWEQYCFSVWCYKKIVGDKQNNIHH